jgi:Sugar (and other) transporter
VDTITLTISTLFYLFLSKNWFYLCFGFTVVGAVSHFYMIVCAPESPKWLLAKNRRLEAVSAFNQIAKLNFTQKRLPSTATFTEFPNADGPL